LGKVVLYQLSYSRFVTIERLGRLNVALLYGLSLLCQPFIRVIWFLLGFGKNNRKAGF
ncbi:MAG: hypothetical protein ACI91G_000818, partial [Gammaproteobacteria bacterium]